MPKRTGDYDAWLLEELADPRIAASYVNGAICEDPDMLKVALRNVAKAYTMKRVAEEAGVARESLYTILSESGNPTLTNLNAVLKAVGLRIAVVPDSEGSIAQTQRSFLSGISFVSQDQNTDLRNLFQPRVTVGFSPSSLSTRPADEHYGLCA